MIGPSEPPLVAIVNSSQSLLALLSSVFQDEGFRTATAYVEDFRLGRRDAGDFFADHDPAVTVFDIGIPYEETWQFFNGLRQNPEVALRRFILVTTNKRIVGSLVGAMGLYEILSKPFDLEDLIAAVHSALGDERASGAE